MNFVNPKNDIAFKKIFGNEKKKEILISFLNAVLDLKGPKEIQTIDILNPYQIPHLVDLKETSLDVRATDKRGITFIVEMQMESKSFLRKKVSFHSAKAYSSQLQRATDLPKLHPVIFIGIFDFKVFDNEHYLSHHQYLNCETLEQSMPEMEYYFIELPKFTKTESELVTILDKWVYFIKHAEDLEMVPEHAKQTHALEIAYDIANRFNWKKLELEAIEYWEMRERANQDTAFARGEKKGLKEGLEQGQQKKALETARKMLADGLDSATVMKYTGLSPDELAALSLL
jgi:predicted transposase/invertase (TIGR01784 family)